MQISIAHPYSCFWAPPCLLQSPQTVFCSGVPFIVLVLQQAESQYSWFSSPFHHCYHQISPKYLQIPLPSLFLLSPLPSTLFVSSSSLHTPISLASINLLFFQWQWASRPFYSFFPAVLSNSLISSLFSSRYQTWSTPGQLKYICVYFHCMDFIRLQVCMYLSVPSENQACS